MIRPTMYSGLSLKNTTARTNMRTGPTIQFWTRDRPRTLELRNTGPISSYRIFARGGYIIRMSPMAMGMDVVPTLNLFKNGTIPGKK